MNVIKTAQARCRAAAARCDITPPVGIYHRMWGAALHDRATGVHRPLEATLMWIEPIRSGESKSQNAEAPAGASVIVSLDHCVLDSAEMSNIRSAISLAAGLPAESILVTLTHTHGSGWMSRSRSHLPGGELLGPYLDSLAARLGELAVEAKSRIVPVSVVYQSGKCDLARHRDFYDKERGRYVCGFNPAGLADDSLLLASFLTESGERLATVVNYACHPTTLAWDNTLISPDWVGAMREVVEREAGGLCLFLQGASGDLGPAEGFVGDTEVADRNGRKVGYATMASLATMPPPGTQYRYSGPVTSGTEIGTWRHEIVSGIDQARFETCRWKDIVVELPYRHDLPSLEVTTAEREHWQEREVAARNAADEATVRKCRAEVEQRTRQITRLNALVPGPAYPLKIRLGILGDAIWIFVPGELYQVFQRQMRSRNPDHPVFVSTLTNDWQPGYIPPASTFGYGIYQEVIAATAAGDLEILIESVSRQLKTFLA
ncbi:hypothetical protein GC170_09740 [bacterium]|nr:hypothetical protein [bacterium]